MRERVMENDFWASKIAETQQQELADFEAMMNRHAEWAETGQVTLSQLVFNCIKSGRGCFYYKSQVVNDIGFDDAVEDAYIQLGLSSNDLEPPSFHDLGHEFEIQY